MRVVRSPGGDQRPGLDGDPPHTLGRIICHPKCNVKTFHVYLHPARGYDAVQEGLCLPALCFNVFWLLFRGLAGPAAAVVIAGALLVGAELTAGRNSVDDIPAWAFRSLTAAGVLTLWLLPFLYGNRWRHANLLRRGFAHVARLPALSGDDAIARALSLDPATSSSPISGQAGSIEAPRAGERRHLDGDGSQARRGRSPRPRADPQPGHAHESVRLDGETVLAAR